MKAICATALVVGLCLAQSVSAGAWLRDKGSGFASLSFGVTETEDATSAIYLEYGLNAATTIGLDISAFSTGSDVRNGFGVLFLRRAIGPTERASKWAYEVGLGAVYEDETVLPAVKTALSWGRGFQLGDRAGWVNVDAGYVHEPTAMNHTTKLDATAGFDFTGVTTGILEVTMSRKNDNSFGAVEPSLLIKPRRSMFQFKLGAQIPMDEDNSSSLKLGIWRSF